MMFIIAVFKLVRNWYVSMLLFYFIFFYIVFQGLNQTSKMLLYCSTQREQTVPSTSENACKNNCTKN